MNTKTDDYVVYHGKKQSVKHIKYRQLCTQLSLTYNAMRTAYKYVNGMVCSTKRKVSGLISNAEDCSLVYAQYRVYREKAKMYAEALREVKRDIREAQSQIGRRTYSMEFLKKAKKKKYVGAFRLQG